MIHLKYKDTSKDILKKYRAESFKVNFTQRYGDMKKIAGDVRLFWNRPLRTISYN